MTTGGGREEGAFDLGFEGVDVFSVRRAGQASMNGQVRSAKHTPSGPRTLRTEYLLCAIYSSDNPTGEYHYCLFQVRELSRGQVGLRSLS